MALIASKATFAPTEAVTGDAPGVGTLHVSHLGQPVMSVTCTERFDLGRLSEGGYSVLWEGTGGSRMWTAIEVLQDPWARLRYGFVADFSRDVDVAAHALWARRLHLTAIQFYDWAWRHEVLVTDAPEYGDPLGRTVSAEVLGRLRDAYSSIGASNCGYAAVYAVDREGWGRWSHAGLFSASGRPYQLGEDFLWILDPSNSEWRDHFVRQIQAAHLFGFDAFHLDQYGWPKHAFDAGGAPVDVARAFASLLTGIAENVPDARWMFNNVNDFPTEVTVQSPQHATYIEVWAPHSTYQSLADLVSKARAANPERAVVLSAYLRPFDDYQEFGTEADAALSLAQAAIASGGANHLIAGGEGRVLFDPYYVNNRKIGAATQRLLERSSDFIVSLGDLLYATDRLDVTETWSFGINEELRFDCSIPLRSRAEAGSIWVRAFKSDQGLTLHFINLADQISVLWDESKSAIETTCNVAVRMQPLGRTHEVVVGRMETGAQLDSIRAALHEDVLEFDIEVTGAWTVVHVRGT